MALLPTLPGKFTIPTAMASSRSVHDKRRIDAIITMRPAVIYHPPRLLQTWNVVRRIANQSEQVWERRRVHPELRSHFFVTHDRVTGPSTVTIRRIAMTMKATTTPVTTKISITVTRSMTNLQTDMTNRRSEQMRQTILSHGAGAAPRSVWRHKNCSPFRPRPPSSRTVQGDLPARLHDVHAIPDELAHVLVRGADHHAQAGRSGPPCERCHDIIRLIPLHRERLASERLRESLR